MRPVVITLLLGAATLSAETINFDSSAAGSLPNGWSLAMTHDGGTPKWETLKDPTAPSSPNVLAQTSNDPTNGRFPLAILDAVTTASGKVSVKFRPISGEVDQAAGLVWRYKDKNNYYVVRANALENNVVLYKVEGGKRSLLALKGRRRQDVRCQAYRPFRRLEHARRGLRRQSVQRLLRRKEAVRGGGQHFWGGWKGRNLDQGRQRDEF